MPHDWNNLLVVTADELVPSFYNSEGALKLEIARHADKDYGIKKVRKGGNGRQMLISFDSLSPEIKNALGDPRKISNPLEMFYKVDVDAVTYYAKEFRFDDESNLSLKHQEEYIINASVLKAAMQLKQAREYERKTKGGSLKCIMKTICNDVIHFNQVLATKHKVQHTLPSSEKRFKEIFRLFSDGFNYGCLISGKLRNENRKLVTDELLDFLNDLFALQEHKPTRTEIVRQYEAFLNGYLEVVNTTTAELYNREDFKPLSESTIRNYLDKWQDKIASYKLRSGDRQRYMGDFKTYHSLEKPSFAGSIISVDDRQPPFKYDSSNNRVWFYLGIDLGSEAWICWVYGKNKEGIIIEFYRQLVRNYVQWGLNLPAEIECEANLNSSFTNTFLRNGAMFNNVRIEANNARGKRIERYNENLRYGPEKQRKGWLARPNAKSEANQAGRRNAFVSSKGDDISKAPIIPFDTIVEGCMQDIEDWNNTPHSDYPDKTRWEVFLQMQHPDLKPINWNAILPYLGYKTQTTCLNNGIIHLHNREFLLGYDGEICLGERLIRMMCRIGGEAIDVYWLDDNNGEMMKALIFLKGQDKMICEAIAKPIYQRAIIERTEKDKRNYEIMSAYVATIDAYGKRKSAERTHLVIIDNRPKTLNQGFKINRSLPVPEININELPVSSAPEGLPVSSAPDNDDEQLEKYIDENYDLKKFLTATK